MIDAVSRQVRLFPDLEALSEEAAREIVRIARECLAARGRFSIALSGGNTPKRTHQLLAERHRGEIDWPNTDVLFGDERFVPHTDARSNYKMARETLLEPAGVRDKRVHPIPTDVASPADAADRYERTLGALLAAHDRSPIIDLVLLGVGPDGHTASLFPGSPALDEQHRWALAVDAPTTVQPAVPRITLTLPVLNSARNVLFLVAGADKRPVLGEILNDAASNARYPASMIAPGGGSVWLVERGAMPG
jgi:6-phosphogluconolactonase